MKMRSALLIGILAASACAKDRLFQDGRLLDPDRNKYFLATDVSTDDKLATGRVYTQGSVAHTDTTSDHYVVESAEFVYLVERVRFKSAKPAELHPNRPVKFAVEKQKIWLLDESGKLQGTTILKRIEKDVPRPSVTAALPVH